MKIKFFRGAAYISVALFLTAILLDAYVWFADPNPTEINSSNGPDWRSISIGHGKITIAHSLQPSDDKKRPGLLTYPQDGGGNFHIMVEKYKGENMSGCYLIFLNQNIPYQLNIMFAFADGDKMTDKSGFKRFGVEFGRGTHSAKMLGCMADDKTSLTIFIGYGLFFTHIKHTINKEQDWCTLMISFWYPIILFGILPAMAMAKKLRNRETGSIKKAAIGK